MDLDPLADSSIKVLSDRAVRGNSTLPGDLLGTQKFPDLSGGRERRQLVPIRFNKPSNIVFSHQTAPMIASVGQGGSCLTSSG